MFETLLSLGLLDTTETTPKGYNILHLCCMESKVVQATLLLQANGGKELVNAKARKHGWRPIHLALLHKKQSGLLSSSVLQESSLLNVLISYGADVNATNNCGVTPLLLECANGSVKNMEYLIRCGADVNLADDNGWVI